MLMKMIAYLKKQTCTYKDKFKKNKKRFYKIRVRKA